MHSFVSCLMHVVFSTKDRRRSIDADLQDRLWPYLGGIARENKIVPIEIGGVADHVHMLVGLPSTMSVSKTVQLIKGNSSKWVHDEFPDRSAFAWQEGYGAFSIGRSGVDATVKYIQSQPEHHERRSFPDELKAILDKHDMDYEDWMLD